ncbi:MAG TPA: hypothetical protein VMV68_03145 [Spirochaetia bacterium]|nr:hypothetical protein [Spirochaetia bacterium]
MEVSTELIGGQIYRMTIDGEKYLGIRVSSHKRNIAEQMQNPDTRRGCSAVAGRVEPWEMVGLVEEGNEIYAYGPYREGRPFSEILTATKERALAQLVHLVGAAAAMQRAGITPSAILPHALLADGAGGLLVLPQPLTDSILDDLTAAERREMFDRFNHPDLKGERGFTFFVGVMLYRVLTGTFPFEGATSEELHERMRRQKLLAPELVKAEIRPEISRIIERLLTPTVVFGITELAKDMEVFGGGSPFREVSAEERARSERERRHVKRTIMGGFDRRVFFRRNWKTMAIIGTVVIVAMIVGGSILSNSMKPRVTAGMTPQQVVGLFYTSMTKFDSQTMQSCVIDGAGKAQISEATNLFVVTRVRTGYEGGSGFVSAQQWIDQGKPKLKSGESVYGVAKLEMTKISNGAYTVSYEKWAPVQQGSASQLPSSATVPAEVQGFDMIDRVYLKNEGKYWAIYKIVNTESKPISPPVVVTDTTAALPSQPQNLVP